MGLQPRNEYESGVYCQKKARSKTRRHGRCKKLSEEKSEIGTYMGVIASNKSERRKWTFSDHKLLTWKCASSRPLQVE